jgi:glyoxalase family protein
MVMKRIPVQGVHHISLVGSNRQSAIDFWHGLLGMLLVLEQPNLDRPQESHLYYDPGDGRLITVFTSEDRPDDPSHHPHGVGHLEHIAFNVSRATQMHVAKRLEARGIAFEAHDRGFMDSIYLRDPNGLKIELACYKFQAPEGVRDVDILRVAHALRQEAGDFNITEEHLADAIEKLMREHRSAGR